MTSACCVHWLHLLHVTVLFIFLYTFPYNWQSVCGIVHWIVSIADNGSVNRLSFLSESRLFQLVSKITDLIFNYFIYFYSILPLLILETLDFVILGFFHYNTAIVVLCCLKACSHYCYRNNLNQLAFCCYKHVRHQ